ncbi:MAG TPA: DsrE/DsrF/DrsH-like family protein [Nitrososphaerales archaeon]|nr:DsrE/DsrF/DrsH-like family protein [Nitrososphaerales archaeon]
MSQQAQKLSIIVSKGSLDMAYPAFMLANAGAAMGMEVHLFFTFWGMAVINKKQEANLQVGPEAAPGMTTPTVRDVLQRLKIPTIPEMVAGAHDMGVHLHACSTTMEMMGMKREDLIPEVEDVVGASTFLQLSENGQTLFI